MVFEFYRLVNLFYLTPVMSHVTLGNAGVCCSMLFLPLLTDVMFSRIIGRTLYVRESCSF